MILGNKGSGVTTQIRKLCDRFKLEEFELQKEFLAKIKKEQDSRRRLRLLKRGFKAMPIDEETGKEEDDPDVVNDPDDFARGEAETKFMAELIDSKKGLVIDGHWTTLPEDSVETPLFDLLLNSKRMPEIVIILKCKEESSFARLVFEDKIKAKFDEIMAKRKSDADKKRADARKEAMDAKLEELKSAAAADEESTPEKINQQLAEAMAEWDETDKEKADDEYIEEEPPVLADMIQAEKDAVTEQIGKD